MPSRNKRHVGRPPRVLPSSASPLISCVRILRHPLTSSGVHVRAQNHPGLVRCAHTCGRPPPLHSPAAAPRCVTVVDRVPDPLSPRGLPSDYCRPATNKGGNSCVAKSQTCVVALSDLPPPPLPGRAFKRPLSLARPPGLRPFSVPPGRSFSPARKQPSRTRARISGARPGCARVHPRQPTLSRPPFLMLCPPPTPPTAPLFSAMPPQG